MKLVVGEDSSVPLKAPTVMLNAERVPENIPTKADMSVSDVVDSKVNVPDIVLPTVMVGDNTAESVFVTVPVNAKAIGLAVAGTAAVRLATTTAITDSVLRIVITGISGLGEL